MGSFRFLSPLVGIPKREKDFFILKCNVAAEQNLSDILICANYNFFLFFIGKEQYIERHLTKSGCTTHVHQKRKQGIKEKNLHKNSHI